MVKSFKSVITALLLVSATSVFGQGLSEQDRSLVDKQRNILANPGLEANKAAWTSSGGTFAIATSGSNLLIGKASGTFDASATSQYVETALTALPKGLYGQNCLAKVKYLGGDSNLTLQATDGTSVIASQALSATTSPLDAELTFQCPSSGSIKLKLLSSADAAIVAIDEAYIGQNYRIGTVAQAAFVGSAYIPKATNCQWDLTSSSIAAFPADTDCPDNFTVENAVTGGGTFSTATNDLPKFTITDLPPGKYMVTMNGNFGAGGGARIDATLSDGTTNSGRAMFIATNTANFPISVSGTFVYGTAGTRTFSMYASSDSGAVSFRNSEANGQVYFTIVRYPTEVQTVYAPNMQPAYARVDIAIGASGYNQTANTSFTTLNNSNNTARRTNYGVCENPTTAGDLGCKISKLPAGKYLIQTVGESYCNTGGRFRVYETVSGTFGGESFCTGVGGQSQTPDLGVLTIASEITNANIVIQALKDSGTGVGYDTQNFTLSLQIIPIEQGIPMPVVINSVQTSYAGQVRSEFANITNSGTCAVASGSSGFIGSISHPSTGKCAITFGTAFSSAPSCTCTVNGTPGRVCAISTAVTTTGLTVNTDQPGASDVDLNFSLQCIGPK